MIVFQSWNSTSPGGTVNYTIGINNPDPTRSIWLFVHVFVEPANVAPDVGESLTAVDERFARLTQPQFDGLAIDPRVTKSVNFALLVTWIVASSYSGSPNYTPKGHEHLRVRRARHSVCRTYSSAVDRRRHMSPSCQGCGDGELRNPARS